MKRALIFCWSESDRYPCEIREDDYIICADSGFKYAERLGLKPDILLGDFDSYSAVGNEAENVITLPTEKDDTDAMYAAKVAMAKGFDEIILAGGIGGREDHTKVDVVKANDELVIPYDRSIRYISVFPCGCKTVGVTLKNTKYELDNYTIRDDFPIGVSNEQLQGKDSVITCRQGGLEVYTIKE